MLPLWASFNLSDPARSTNWNLLLRTELVLASWQYKVRNAKQHVLEDDLFIPVLIVFRVAMAANVL